jgi:hypothetical protein
MAKRKKGKTAKPKRSRRQEEARLIVRLAIIQTTATVLALIITLLGIVKEF